MTYGEYLGAGSTTTKGLYHLNGNSTDSSGNGNNGTWGGTVTYVDGKFGKCASFDGSSSKITLPANILGTGNNPFTVSLWGKINSNKPSGGLQVFASGGDTTTQRYQIDYYNNGGTLQIRGLSVNESNIYFTITYDIDLTTLGWCNLLYKFDGTTTRLFLNGKEVGTAQTISGTIRSDSIRSVLGTDWNSNLVYLNGSIDEVIIENRAWTAQEVQKYYTYALGRFASL